MGKTFKKLPISERGFGVRCVTRSERIFVISNCVDKDRFTLWEELDNGYRKLTDGNTPYELYSQVPWKE